MLIFGFIFLMAEMGRHTFSLKTEYTRKWVHLTSGLCCLSFPFFISNHWIVLILCSGFMMLLFVSSRNGWLQSINGIGRKSYGSLLFPVSVYLSFIGFKYLDENYIYFYLPIIILAVCDPLAALTGGKWAYGKYAIGDINKTLVGTGAFFTSCFAILLGSFWFLDPGWPMETLLGYSFIIAAIASLTEAVSKNGIDNVTIPLCVIVLLILLM
jgi:dolichol kinase